jgi:histidinol-phosphate phosphatase family protein
MNVCFSASRRKIGKLHHSDTLSDLSRIECKVRRSEATIPLKKQDQDRKGMGPLILQPDDHTYLGRSILSFLVRRARKYNGLMYPSIFLDRDGVLIENRSDYVRDWSQVKIIPEAVRALSLAPIKKYKVVIVTNQSAVGRGLILLKTAEEINQRLFNLIRDEGGQIDGVYMCPHKPEDGCSCRKPLPGLLLQAAKDLSLDLKRSWMIGDAWSDVQAGEAAGLRGTILLRTGRGTEQLLQARLEKVTDNLVFDNLPLAFEAILSIDNDSAIGSPS